jgi:hypothetical protein
MTAQDLARAVRAPSPVISGRPANHRQLTDGDHSGQAKGQRRIEIKEVLR